MSIGRIRNLIAISWALCVFVNWTWAQTTTDKFACVTKFDASDWQSMMAYVGETNPAAAAKIETDRTFRQNETDKLYELFAFACQAIKEGMADDPKTRRELSYRRLQVTALRYAMKHHSNSVGDLYDFISQESIDKFLANSGNRRLADQFAVDTVWLSDGQLDERRLTEKDLQSAREAFAKLSICRDEYLKRFGSIDDGFRRVVEIQIKLQQAEVLARRLTEAASLTWQVSDDDTAKYLRLHPETKESPQAVKENLSRAKEDEFAARVLLSNPVDMAQFPRSLAKSD